MNSSVRFSSHHILSVHILRHMASPVSPFMTPYANGLVAIASSNSTVDVRPLTDFSEPARGKITSPPSLPSTYISSAIHNLSSGELLFSVALSSTKTSLMATAKAPPLPIPTPKLLSFRFPSNPGLWRLPTRKFPRRFGPQPFLFIRTNAFYTEGLPTSVATRRDKSEAEQDDIGLLNERIRREHKRREGTKAASKLDSAEAEKYIKTVKEQQQRGLQKLKGNVDGKEGGFGYRVDPYSLRPGDYVVHKRVGIGKFVAIKYDVPKNSSSGPIEYVFIEYADGMAKLPVKQASRMLYRYNL